MEMSVTQWVILAVWRSSVGVLGLGLLAAVAKADSARIVAQNEGSTDFYVARVVMWSSLPGSRSDGWVKVPAGQSIRIDDSGDALLYWFCFAKKDEHGQFGAFTPSFSQRGDLVTSSNRQFMVRTASWTDGGPFKTLEYQATARAGFSKVPFPLCVDARPYSDISYNYDLTFPINPDANKIVAAIGGRSSGGAAEESIGLQQPTRDATNEELAVGAAAIGAIFGALYNEILSPRPIPQKDGQLSDLERRQLRRRAQAERDRRIQAKAERIRATREQNRQPHGEKGELRRHRGAEREPSTPADNAQPNSAREREDIRRSERRRGRGRRVGHSRSGSSTRHVVRGERGDNNDPEGSPARIDSSTAEPEQNASSQSPPPK